MTETKRLGTMSLALVLEVMAVDDVDEFLDSVIARPETRTRVRFDVINLPRKKKPSFRELGQMPVPIRRR